MRIFFKPIQCLLIFILMPVLGLGQVVINEFQASNNNTIADDDGDYEDWIELFYSGVSPIDLGYYGLSDDENEPFQWVFPPGTIMEPGDFLLIWASGKNKSDPNGDLHTNFRIAREGEPLLLTHHLTGERLDHVPPVAVPSDLSHGRITDGGEEWAFFETPTPGQSNASSTGYRSILSAPEPSATGGFHPEAFELELSPPAPGAEIRYTLDGSCPTPDSPLYETPIHITDRSAEPNDLSEILEISHRYAPAARPYEAIFKGTVVRARAFREGDYPGPVMTETYFIHPDRHHRYSIPVLAINTDREHLFDHEKGIYVLGRVHEEWLAAGGNTFNGGAPANYNRRGEEWERPAHFTMFNAYGEKEIDQPAGIRIHGGWSRAFPQKSFRLYSRSSYGESRFSHRVFPDLELDDFNRLILRQSGQDVTSTMFRDVYIQESVKHMKFDIQHFLPSVLFINGEYWGIYNIRQRYDRHYLETHYGVGEEEVDLLTRSAIGNQVKIGDSRDYLLLRHFIHTNDMNDPGHYALVREKIDLENLIDYFIAGIFASNTDWPHNNIDFWRMNHGEYLPDAPIPEQDGRWRWLMFDTDFGFGWYSRYTDNTLRRVTGAGRTAWSNLLFNGLMESREFRNDFYNRYADMLNTAFLPSRMTTLLDSLKAIYKPEITEHIQRRGAAGNWDYPQNKEEWRGKVNVMRTFVERRPAFEWRYLMQFDDRDTVRVRLDLSDDTKGYVTINRTDIRPGDIGISENPWPWSGFYFSGIPLTLTAHPREGYQFTGWLSGEPDHPKTNRKANQSPGAANDIYKPLELISKEKTISLLPENASYVLAGFEPKETDIPPEEITTKPFALHPNYPNPFNAQTSIRFDLPEAAHVRINIYDITGRHVFNLMDSTKPEGQHQVLFDASRLLNPASGLYLYRMEAGAYQETKKMMLVK